VKYRAQYTKEAERRILSLDPPIKERVRVAVERLCSNPDLGKRLTGIFIGRWSYRVGDWRIIYKVHKDRLIVLVLTVGHRREVYRA
jgi:mRNA interferase RelE/StbE